MVSGQVRRGTERSASPVLGGSHRGHEETIAVDIARYTATDAIVESPALKVRKTAVGTCQRALFDR